MITSQFGAADGTEPCAAPRAARLGRSASRCPKMCAFRGCGRDDRVHRLETLRASVELPYAKAPIVHIEFFFLRLQQPYYFAGQDFADEGPLAFPLETALLGDSAE